MKQGLYDILKKYWGYDSLRGVQAEVIENVLTGCDTLALMPTGGGKSLTYQLPAMMMEGLCVVVTPLIALMKDQVDALRRRGISAVAIHSGQSGNAIEIALDNCTYGDVKFLYVSPERIAGELFQIQLARMKVALIAVDEAHCISQWGYDFRPSYLKIATLRRIHPSVPLLALTASATPRVAEDIINKLDFGSRGVLNTPYKLIRDDFARPNLSFSVRHTDDKRATINRILGNVAGTAIIYVRSRERAERIAAELAEDGFSADFYHAGLNHTARTERQNEWFRGTLRVMVATTAFGMGIDKADVRVVVHYDVPSSLEEYYQEAGRAGRDGKKSYAVLLAGSDEESKHARRLENEFPDLETIRRIYEQIGVYMQVALGEGKYYSREFNPYDFSRRYKVFGATLEGALSILQQNGYLSFEAESENPARLMFCVSRDDLYSLRINRRDLDDIIRTILRLYTGVFSDFRAIDIAEISSYTGYSDERVRELLKVLWDLHVIRYIPSSRAPMLTFLEDRQSASELYISPQTLAQRKERASERLEAMLRYAANETECRSVVLQRYFGQTDAVPCGVCDVCLARRKTAKEQSEELETQILRLLAVRPLSIKELVKQFKLSPEKIVAIVEHLHHLERVTTSKEGTLHLR